jgi:hypothetical protein
MRRTIGELATAMRDAPAFVIVIVVEAAFRFATVAEVDVRVHRVNVSYGPVIG